MEDELSDPRSVRGPEGEYELGILGPVKLPVSYWKASIKIFLPVTGLFHFVSFWFVAVIVVVVVRNDFFLFFIPNSS